MKMMRKTSSMKVTEIRRYTLIEILCAMSILALLISMVGIFFFDGSRICREAITRADAGTELAILRGKWRNFIGRCHDDIVLKDGILVSGNASASFANSKLTLSSENEKTEIPLPEKTRVLISVEKNEGLADCIVLSIAFPDGRQRRIVACNENL